MFNCQNKNKINEYAMIENEKTSKTNSTKLVELPSTRIDVKIGDKSDKFVHSLDLDALYGHMTYKEFKETFVQNVKIDISNSIADCYIKTNKIKTWYNVESCNLRGLKDIRQFPYVRLGACQATDFGSLDLYFVLLNSELSNEELRVSVYKTLKKSIEVLGVDTPSLFFSTVITKQSKELNGASTENLKCKANYIDFFKALDFLFCDRYKQNQAVIYFETFGNKKDTVSNSMSFNSIKEKIHSTFTEAAEKYITVDVCIASTFGDGTVTLANENFFSAVGISPNFKPLFSNTLLNCSHKSDKNIAAGSEKIGVFKRCLKINFYSTFKNYFDFDNSPSYIFPLTISSLLSDLFGHRVYCNKDKLSNLVSKYKGLKEYYETCATKGTCLYRTELRCKLNNAEKLLSKLKAFLLPTYFSYYSSKDFYEILTCNINNFISLISSGQSMATPDSLTNTLITEYILKTLYLTGSAPISAFTKEQNEKIIELIPLFKGSIGVLQDIKTVAETVCMMLSKEEKNNLLKAQIKYSYVLSLHKKFMLLEITKSHFLDNLEPESIISKMWTSYVIDKTGNINSSMDYLVNSSGNSDQVPVMSMTKKLFTHSNKSKKSSIAKIWFQILKTKLALTDDSDVLSVIIKFMKLAGITSCFKYVAFQKLEMVDFVYDLSKDSYNGKNKHSIKKMLFRKYISASELTKAIKNYVPDDELVRYLHAFYRHSGSSTRIQDVLFDFNYGFCPVRNESFIRNKLNQLKYLVYNKEKFNEILYLVKSWSPEMLNNEERMLYFAENSIVISDDLRVEYEELLVLDNDEWWSSNVRFDIANDSDYEVFYKIVKNASPYTITHDIIKSYCDDCVIFSIIPIRTILQDAQVHAEEPCNSETFEISYEYNNEQNTYDKPQVLKEEIKKRTISEKIEVSKESAKSAKTSLIFNKMLEDKHGFPCSLQLSNEASIFKKPKIFFRNYGILCCKENTEIDTGDYPFEAYDTPAIEEIFEGNLCHEIKESNDDAKEEESVFELYFRKIFDKYRYKKFNASTVRREQFSAKNRPTNDVWKQFINCLIKDKTISLISRNNYIVNLTSVKKGDYLEYKYVFNLICRSLRKQIGEATTACALRISITSDLRPSIENWQAYLEDMAANNNINSKATYGFTYYSMI